LDLTANTLLEASFRLLVWKVLIDTEVIKDHFHDDINCHPLAKGYN